MPGIGYTFKELIYVSVGMFGTGLAIGISLPATLRWLDKYFSKCDEYNFTEIYESIFFSNSGNSCQVHFNQENDKRSCGLPNCSFYNLSRMLHYLNSAKKSLDVCLYLITVKDLGQAILKAHRRGVKVRVITDEDMGNSSGTQIHSFRHGGIPVRNELKSKVLMHHKWVVIDGEVLMTGSLNWTMQALCCNYDNLFITNQPSVVSSYKAEFERLWTFLQ